MRVGCVLSALIALLLLAPATVRADATKHTIDLRPGERSIFCVVGDTLRFAGHYSSTETLTKVRFEIDNRPAIWRELETTGDDDYSFTWIPRSLDRRYLDVCYLLGSGSKAYVQQVAVDPLPQAPIALPALPAQAFGHLDIAPGVNCVPGFKLARIEIELNGELAASSSTPPYAVTVPLDNQPFGACTVQLEAYSPSGERYEAPAATVTVLPYLQVVMPQIAEMDKPGDTIPLGVKLETGVPVARVEYYVEGLLVDSTTQAPYTINADLSALTTGEYQVMARLIDTDGNSHDSPPLDLPIVNKPQEVVEAEVDNAMADSQREQVSQAQALLAEASANTKNAYASGLVAITADPIQVSSGPEPTYTVVLHVANRSTKAVGPILPSLIFNPGLIGASLLPVNGYKLSPASNQIVINPFSVVVPGGEQETLTYTAPAAPGSGTAPTPLRIDIQGLGSLVVNRAP